MTRIEILQQEYRRQRRLHKATTAVWEKLQAAVTRDLLESIKRHKALSREAKAKPMPPELPLFNHMEA